MFAVNDTVVLVAPADDLKTEAIPNDQLKRIVAAVGGEQGIVTGCRAANDGSQILSVAFPVTYRGEFYGLPAAMLVLA